MLQNKTTKELRSVVKLKGISLSSALVDDFMTFEAFQYEFQQFLADSISYSKILQERRRGSTKASLSSDLSKHFTLITFTHSLYAKRAKVLSDGRTLPFGYR